MGRQRWFLVVLVAVVAALVACAPKAVPVPAPTPAVPAAPAAPAITPEEAAWAEIVAAAKKEGKLTVYGFSFFGDIGVNLRKAFTERTGIGLDIISASSTVLLERIKAERRAATQIASVQNGAGAVLRLSQKDGLTERIGYLPELKDEGILIYDPWLDKDNIIALHQSIYSPWVNTKLVPPGTEPKSWRDLLKPEWKEKIGIADPAIEPPANVVYVALTKHGRLDEAYFKELVKQKLQFQPTSRMNVEAAARGEISIAWTAAPGSAMPFLREGAPLRAIDMAEGVVIVRGAGVVLLKGAPQPNAARVFINFLASREGQTVYLKNYGAEGFRKDVPSFIPPQAQFTRANPIVLTLEDELEIARVQREKVFSKLLTGK